MSRRPLPPARDVLAALLPALAVVGACVLASLALRATVGPGLLSGLALGVLPLLLVLYVVWLERRP